MTCSQFQSAGLSDLADLRKSKKLGPCRQNRRRMLIFCLVLLDWLYYWNARSITPIMRSLVVIFSIYISS